MVVVYYYVAMVECGSGSCILLCGDASTSGRCGGTLYYLQVDNAGLYPIYLALVVYAFVPPPSADALLAHMHMVVLLHFALVQHVWCMVVVVSYYQLQHA